MADIIITIPANKLQLVKDWVDSRTNAGQNENWTDAEYADYVDSLLTSWLRSQVYGYQMNEYQKSFVFDDPTG